MKILITGANGQLGYELARTLTNHDLILTDLAHPGFNHPELDITNGEAVYEMMEEEQPDWVIHGAAFTKVDLAQANPDTAFEINRDGSQNVAEATASIGAKLIAISTDYVFSGQNPPVGGYTEDDEVNPINVYGESKLAGEIATLLAHPEAIILRTAWLYGGSPKNAKLKNGQTFNNFPNSILTKAQAGEKLTVVSDQVGSPTYAGHLAQVISQIIHQTLPGGIYHAVNSGQATWFELAQELLKQAKLKNEIQPIKTNSLKLPARRPANSVLSTKKLQAQGIILPSWTDGLKEYLSG